MATATPVPTVTATPAATPEATVSPTPTATPVASTTQPAAPDPVSLGDQLAQVDPLVWAALLGVLVIPFLVQGLKKLVKHLGAPLTSRISLALLGVVSSATAYLVNVLSTGVLDKLGNPILSLLLTAFIIFATGSATYTVVMKKSPQTSPELPVNENP